ncbi:MAG TPA: BamA/TamA family outer membrane protein [Polyangiaceae bacterium]|nr:BamA/TamA family outer membrane protein [Polyangiaceae bacterium]
MATQIRWRMVLCAVAVSLSVVAARAAFADEPAPSSTANATPTPPSNGTASAAQSNDTPTAPPAAVTKPPDGQAAPTNDAGGETFDYRTPRLEPAGFPLIGGDSDIGVEFGAVGTLTKLGGDVRPYLWNMDLLISLSAKSDLNGTEITQQNYLWDIDVPGLFGGRLRLNPAVSFERTVNQGYFGLGNASSATLPAGTRGDAARFFQLDEREARLRELTRIRFRPPVDIMVATTFRYDDPHAYPGSRLALDAASGAVRGVGELGIVLVGAGIVYDTRDNEYFPRWGSYHQIGLRVAQGFPTGAGVRYGGFGAMLAKYAPIGGPFIVAMRATVDAEFGDVPFSDLFTGGPFQTYEMIGGSAAIRGVPDGRYSGELKLFGNLELRALLVQFHLLGQGFHLGGNVLFDAGRLWKNYSFDSPEDGRGIGIKWGTGAGAYLQWGQAAVFRIEVAYSPDATSENPGFPFGVYVEDGVMF